MSAPQYQYAPVPVPAVERPRCWGLSFDETNRECRGCQVQGTCRDEVFKKHAAQQRPYYGAPSYALPQAPIPLPYQPPVAAPAPRAVPVPYQAAPGQQSVIPAYGYGSTWDPITPQLYAAPPVHRVQLPGESFMERMFKNVALGMLEAFAINLVLGVRQAVWAPKKDPERLVDATRVEK